MNIGILADIHGNHRALKSVLDDMRMNKVDHLLILGDIVGYYYDPEIILDYLGDWSKDLIKGNHEAMLEIGLKDNIERNGSFNIIY